jgi:hypothetical protein
MCGQQSRNNGAAHVTAANKNNTHRSSFGWIRVKNAESEPKK